MPLTIAHARSAGVDPNEGKDNPFSAPESGKKADLCLTCSKTGRRGGLWGENGTGGTGSYGA